MNIADLFEPVLSRGPEGEEGKLALAWQAAVEGGRAELEQALALLELPDDDTGGGD